MSSGFIHAAAWAGAHEAGQRHITSFRKAVPSAATVAGDYVDYAYFSGNPVANFYASTPLESALIGQDKGLRLPSGEQWIRDLMVMSAASSATSTTNQNQTLILCDYLMYYPFVDTDAVGEEQVMTNSVSLPRRTTVTQTAEQCALNTDFKLGTVAGSPGTPPTNWSVSSAPTGMTREIDFGTDAYGDYLQVRYYGTNTSGSTQYPAVSTYNTLAPTVGGETWTISADVALVGGAWPTGASVQVAELSGALSWLRGSSSSFLTLVTSATPVNVSVARTVGADAAYAQAFPTTFTINNGEAADFTFRVYNPMFCKRDTPAPYVKATTARTSITWERDADPVKVMCIAQAAASAYGAFTMRYTNQDGVPNRISQVTTTKTVNGGGVSVLQPTAAARAFVDLRIGDTSVRSIESITFTAAGGGLMALVLVQPLTHIQVTQECRRTTSGNLESYGAANHLESLIHQVPVKIKDGAVLGFLGQGNAGSLASSILTGVLATQWGN